MNYGIGNVKGGSGKTPTITLASSQFVDAENFVLTNEQAKIIQENDVIHLSVSSYPLITIYKIASNYYDLGIDVFTHLYDDVEIENGGALQSSFIAINPTTKAGAIYRRTINGATANPTLDGNEAELTSIAIGGEIYKVGGGGKQLYQHTINIRSFGNAVYIFRGNIIIINDDPTPFTNTSLNTWLFDNGFKSHYENNQQILDGVYGNINFGTVRNSNNGKAYTAWGILCRDLTSIGASKTLSVAYFERDTPAGNISYENLYVQNSSNNEYQDIVIAL